MILTLILVFGGLAAAVALFGAGGYVQRRKEKGELGDDGEQGRPEHHVGRTTRTTPRQRNQAASSRSASGRT